MVIKHFLVYFINKYHWSRYPVPAPHWVITLSYLWSYLTYVSLGYYGISFSKVLHSGLTAALLWKRQYFSIKSKHSCLLKFIKSFKTPWDKKSSVYKCNKYSLTHSKL